ncbi:MotA/TolQ/ExbB proton channel [Oleiphilus messinensis]|uniref:MotA/TolQ/ExbB proton channel n=1 Tax=Oleiphilus messinensis TaxID=141451 RepID=A0A1Y0IDL7_9GAMM|nr:MotA/TolQ/ExbB proton channel family protein [Oleiphilus messinensis]ARU57876.1 MotA/TolQ/ExbB proton channel [Oleiphilus messinensis]
MQPDSTLKVSGIWPDAETILVSLELFFRSGGPVLILLAFVGLALWMLLLERFWFRFAVFPSRLAACRRLESLKARRLQSCDLTLEIDFAFPLIKTLIAICPLLGLLGTVTGMIQLFDVMSAKGTANPRLMASGVAQATLPTMAGMTLAVTGLLCFTWLQRWGQLQRNHIRDLTTI